MSRTHHGALIAAVAFLVCTEGATGKPAGPATSGLPTLRYVLQENKINNVAKIDNLDRQITSFDFANDAHTFGIAYYLYNSATPDALDHILWVVTLDKNSNRWRQRRIDFNALPSDFPKTIQPYGGSVMSVTFGHDNLYVEFNVSPSATNTLMLTRDLHYRSAYYGWAVAELSNGDVIFHQSMVHFAPTHTLKLSVFSPRTGSSTQILPSKREGPIMLARDKQVRRVNAARGIQWFAERNYSPDPESMNSALISDVVVNDATRSFAFAVAYDVPDILSQREVGALALFSSVMECSWQFQNCKASDMNRLFGDIMYWQQVHREQSVLRFFSGCRTMQNKLQWVYQHFNYLDLNANAAYYNETRRLLLDPYWTSASTRQYLAQKLAVRNQPMIIVYVYRYTRDYSSFEHRELHATIGQTSRAELRQFTTQPRVRRLFASR